MSRFEDGSYGSLSGVALIAKVLAGRCGMKYTRAALGKGLMPDDKTPKTMMDCAEYVMDAMIAGITNPVDGECQVTVQVKSDNVEAGFYCTNIVLFAEDPDEGEVPYTYLSLENEPEWIRPASSIVGKLATFDLIAAVGDVDVVDAVIDPDSLMTRAAAERLIAEATALSVTDIFIPKDGWKSTEGQEEAIGNGLTLYQDIALSGVRSEQFPAVTIRTNDIRIAQQAGLCTTALTMDGAIRLWTKESPVRDMEATLALYDVRSAVIKSITIPADGWRKFDESVSPEIYREFSFYQDVKVGGVTQDKFPSVSLHIPSLSVAWAAGLCPTVQPLTGALRFWSVNVPEEDLSATAAILFHASGFGMISSHAVIVDGVKVKPGSGLTIDSSGNLALDTATSEDVANLFNGSNAPKGVE